MSSALIQTFLTSFQKHFNNEPTAQQAVVMEQLTHFLFSDADAPCFLLSGYAGTGKSSLLGAFVKTLTQLKGKVKLLAPTGRAAKVLGDKSNRPATTIHKQIYRRGMSTDGSFSMTKMPNLSKNTVFIVDEASMIGDFTLESSGDVNQRNLLEDLMEHVFSREGCRLILLGDEGQLPPVGSDESPALNVRYMKENFPRLTLQAAKLTEVVRQKSTSMILENATYLRSIGEVIIPKLKVKGEVRRLQGDETQEELESSYARVGKEETLVVTRSNKRANLFNQHIRARLFYREEDLSAGDILMAVKNNYFWVEEDSPMGFIANGEMLEVKRITDRTERYGFHFVKAQVQFVDYPELSERDIWMIIDTLTSEGPSLNKEQQRQLYVEIEKEYFFEKNKRKRMEAVLRDPFFNALQVKFAYAVTCHKAQGGQWKNVFVDQGYFVEDMMDSAYLRWLYTAFTRATEQVFLINFHSLFFTEEVEVQ